jgi:hypothetical protein
MKKNKVELAFSLFLLNNQFSQSNNSLARLLLEEGHECKLYDFGWGKEKNTNVEN